MSNLKAQYYIDRECTDKCKSQQHAKNLCSVITKRCVTDSDLCAYLQWKCSACGQVVDDAGRSALHFAASCGRRQVLDWLIRNKGANINLKDMESGYTPLHRSMFYGKINTAVLLIQLGANISLTDHIDLTAFDHIMKDRLTRVDYSSTIPSQIYVWGTNSNYTLGTGSQHSRQLPELLDTFHKRNTNVYIKQACLQKYHSVLVSLDGRVFSCGCGHRLGVNSEDTVITPQEIKFNVSPFICAEASIGSDHSVFLSDSGQIWTCGLNTYHVLGIKPPPLRALVPKALPDFHCPIKGVCAGSFHTVAWGPTAVYTWGLHAGQLGHDQSSNKTYVAPKLVTAFWGKDVKIKSVTVSDGATVVCTELGDIYVLHEYQCRKIASRKLNIEKITVVGGHLNSKLSSDVLIEKGGDELKVLVVTSTGKLYLWRETWPQLTRCIFNLIRPLTITDAFLNQSEVLFVTNDGEAFHGEFKTKKKKSVEVMQNIQKSAFTDFIEKDECQMVKIRKFPHIHRAVKIQSDPKGRNYAVLQNDPCSSLIDIPQISRSTLSDDMLNLLEESDEMDTIHDVLFKVGQQIFAVHRYIIALQSEMLDSMIEKNAVSERIIEINHVHPLLFHQLLLYIYTGKCALTTCGECPSDLNKIGNGDKNKNIKTSDCNDEIIMDDLDISAYEYHNKKRNKAKNKENEIAKDNKDPIRLLQEISKRFGVKSLYKVLNNFIYVDGFIQKKTKNSEKVLPLKFDRSLHENLYDIYIKTRSGVEIPAHKCILAARLEYFNNLFALRWNKNATRNIISMPIAQAVMQHVIDFLYTDKAQLAECSDDTDHISDILIVADELFIDRLKEICEVALSTLITLRNVTQMLHFSSIYNASQLKRCTMEFICLNLSAIFESRALESLDIEILDELATFYCEWNPVLSNRVITSFSDAPSDEEVKNIHEMHPVMLKLDQNNDEIDKRQQKTGAKRRLRVRKISSSENMKNKMKNETITSLSLESKDSINTNIIEDKNKPEKEWITVSTEKEKHQKIVQARLRAIASTKKELNDKFVGESFTKLISSPKTIPIKQTRTTISPVTSPTLNSPISSPSSYTNYEQAKSPPICDIPINVMQKMSQKKRKKFAQLSLAEHLSAINQSHDSQNEVTEAPTCPKNPWGKSDSGVLSTSPKSPWQKIEMPVLASSPETKQNFLDIIANEKKQKENWIKMRTKDLIYTQMEDKAIEDLKRFYNSDEMSDEYITIHRVDKGIFAVPFWVHSKRSQ